MRVVSLKALKAEAQRLRTEERKSLAEIAEELVLPGPSAVSALLTVPKKQQKKPTAAAAAKAQKVAEAKAANAKAKAAKAAATAKAKVAKAKAKTAAKAKAAKAKAKAVAKAAKAKAKAKAAKAAKATAAKVGKAKAATAAKAQDPKAKAVARAKAIKAKAKAAKAAKVGKAATAAQAQNAKVKKTSAPFMKAAAHAANKRQSAPKFVPPTFPARVRVGGFGGSATAQSVTPADLSVHHVMQLTQELQCFEHYRPLSQAAAMTIRGTEPAVTYLEAAFALAIGGENVPAFSRAIGLFGLGRAIGGDHHVSGIVRGEMLSRRDLYLMCIDVEPNYGHAYNNLMTLMGELEVAVLKDGRKMSKIDLLIESIRVLPTVSRSYYNLAMRFGSIKPEHHRALTACTNHDGQWTQKELLLETNRRIDNDLGHAGALRQLAMILQAEAGDGSHEGRAPFVVLPDGTHATAQQLRDRASQIPTQ